MFYHIFEDIFRNVPLHIYISVQTKLLMCSRVSGRLLKADNRTELLLHANLTHYPSLPCSPLLRSSLPSIPMDPNIPERRYSACLAPNGVSMCARGPQPFTSSQKTLKKQTPTDNSVNTHTETHTAADAKRHEHVESSAAITHITTHTHMNRGCSVGWSVGICRIWPGWSLLESPGEVSAPNAIIYHQNTHIR